MRLGHLAEREHSTQVRPVATVPNPSLTHWRIAGRFSAWYVSSGGGKRDRSIFALLPGVSHLITGEMEAPV